MRPRLQQRMRILAQDFLPSASPRAGTLPAAPLASPPPITHKFRTGKRMNKKISMILILLIVLFTGCNHTPASAPEISATPTIYAISVDSTPNLIYEFRQGRLECNTYVNATWGDGPTNWGSPHQYHLYNWANGDNTIPPLAFGDGAVFFYDVINHRILAYQEDASTPTIIPVPSEYTALQDDYGAGPRVLYFGDFTAYQNTFIFFYQSLDSRYPRLGIIDHRGSVLQEINLPYMNTDAISPVLQVDSRGNLYVAACDPYVTGTGGLIYIHGESLSIVSDLRFFNVRNFPPLRVGWNDILYKPSVGSPDQAFQVILSWQLPASGDFTQSSTEYWILVFPEGMQFKRFLGADQNGNIYFVLEYNRQKICCVIV